MNIYSWLDIHAKERPNKICIKTRDKEITYAELQKWSRCLGTALRKAGIGKRDHAILMLPNIPEFVISYMAIAGLGATVVPVNPSYTVRELAHIIKDSDSKAIILEQNNVDAYRDIKEQCPLDIIITTGEGGNFREWASGEAREICEDLEPDTVASMVYSSGLIGYPMGAMLTHTNLDHNSDLMRLCMDSDESEMMLTVIPLFHSFSASCNMLSMLRYGGTIYLMKRLEFKELNHALKEAGITALVAVPTLFFGLVHHPDVQDLSYTKVRTLVAGGSALSIEIYNAFKEKFHQDIRQGYGITEASPVCTVNRKHRPIKPESIGQTVPGVKAMVVDENRNPLEGGRIGELLFKGPNIMKGYYKREKETSQILKDGWLYTGDLGYMDEDGYIFITGYKKEMVITSGFNVYCKEVEGVLNTIPGVKDSAITGIPDLMRGAIIKAYIVRENMHLTEHDIKHYARKQLASYKTPRVVVFVDAIPRDEKGKARLEKLQQE
jgi:long-chain acyl-CoA synthetase